MTMFNRKFTGLKWINLHKLSPKLIHSEDLTQTNAQLYPQQLQPVHEYLVRKSLILSIVKMRFFSITRPHVWRITSEKKAGTWLVCFIQPTIFRWYFFGRYKTFKFETFSLRKSRLKGSSRQSVTSNPAEFYLKLSKTTHYCKYSRIYNWLKYKFTLFFYDWRW